MKVIIRKCPKFFCTYSYSTLTCSPPGSQSAAITTPLCPESARNGVRNTENSSLSSVSVPENDSKKNYIHVFCNSYNILHSLY